MSAGTFAQRGAHASARARLVAVMMMLGPYCAGCHSADPASDLSLSCTLPSDCPPGLTCLGGVCHVECVLAEDCEADEVCRDGTCEETNGGEGGTAGEAATRGDGAFCSGGDLELGQVATWCSKVNVHSSAAGWQTDADCTSNCYVDMLDYCRKFWSDTSYFEEVAVTATLKPFSWRACKNVEMEPGERQFRCCRPP